MITKDNFKELLNLLKFTSEGNIYTKHFPQHDAFLKVDFQKEKIIYPDKLIVSGEFTTSFSQDENFVVFECVHRLMEKGYKPEHLELEKKWKSGHGSSGGRADIIVKNHQNDPILIIECKTAGREFEDAWRVTNINGGQILTYADRERTTKFVCLYASDLKDIEQKAIPKHYIVAITDIKNLVEQFEGKEKRPLFYKDITDVKQWFQVWNETYKKDYKTKGIFEEDVQAYNIGKENITEKDLQNINEKDIQGKYHQFATTLRQYNVSGRENAFDKLVNLFLCKVVDEKRNKNKLDFYWKGEYFDTFFDLQDRLQKLYQAGMKEFLGEEVTYIDNKQIDDAFRYVKNDPDATKDTIKKFFTQLKFFTNNDFAFIDVHNENLFYQNAVVLLEIVKMLQDIRLCTNEQNQFLGDLFEGFLDAGVKQSEGQFFTPMPITKFILMSLPLENIINETLQPPKMIDYACGSGHFLNELAGQIKPFVEAKGQDIKQYYEQIVGIEKEYRLSKVAKVSAFMYGQDQVQVIFNDALVPHVAVKENAFSVLVANPPYSVKGFLETIPQDDRERYSLLQYVDNKTFSKNNSIQCFFIERAKQLLKPKGVAGIVLPTSILSNTKGLEIATRELILQYFDIVAIVEFGSKTFGKTGTNTVTLFLKRKLEDPAPAHQYRNRVNKWFSKTTDRKDDIFEDIHLLKAYTQHVEIPIENYQYFLQYGIMEKVEEIEIFKEYRKDFETSSEYKDILKKYAKQNLRKENIDKIEQIEADKQTEIEQKLNDYVLKIEQDKVYYFVLAYLQAPVLVVKSPADNKAQKQFLGYDWSGAKGKEGIKYLGNAKVAVEVMEDDKNPDEASPDDEEDKRILENLSKMKNINTPLYDPQNHQNPEKLNYWIQQNFIGNTIQIPENLKSFMAYAPMTDLLDFKQKTFGKQILLSSKKNTNIESKWELVRLGDVCEISIGGTPSRENANYFTGENLWVSIAEMKEQIIYDTKEKITDEGVKKSNVKLIPKGTTLLSFKLSIGKTAIAGRDLYTNEAIAGLIPKNKNIKGSYLFHLFSAKTIDLSTSNNAIGQSLNSKFLRDELKIPLPPLEIQEAIVKACESVDWEVEKAKVEIEELRNELKNKVESVQNKGYAVKRLSDVCAMQAGKFVSASDINDNQEEGLYPCYGGNGLRGYTKSFTHEGEFPLVGRQGALCGNVHKVSGQFHATEHAVVVTSHSDVDVNWLYYQLISLNLNQYATGSAQPGLSVQKILTVTTPVPPLEIQQKLVSEILILEKKISLAQSVLVGAGDRKAMILREFL